MAVPFPPRLALWQADAADQLRLGNGQLASWLRLTDECSGAILKTVVFPLGVQRGAAPGRPRGAAPGLRAVGAARAAAAGQRLAVGRLVRPADAAGVGPGRAGAGAALQRPALPAAGRGGGAQPPDDP